MSAATRRREIDRIYQGLGGYERAIHEFGKPGMYAEFFKYYAKGQISAAQNSTDHSINAASVESLWEKLEARKKAAATGQIHEVTVIDVEPEEA